MSKKVFHSREHRERAQPANRTRLGLLEKKKDYILRARDFQSKKKRLQSMKVKAAYKNPDEFYFGMVKSRVDKATGRVRGEAEHETLPGEVIKLMKSQDLKHIQEMIRVNEGKLEGFKAEHAIIIGEAFKKQAQTTGDRKKGSHVKFIEDDDELADLILDNTEKDDADAVAVADEAVALAKDQIIQEHQARLDRIKTLKLAERKLLQEKLAVAKGSKRKVKEDADGIPVYKFAQERKK